MTLHQYSMINDNKLPTLNIGHCLMTNSMYEGIALC